MRWLVLWVGFAAGCGGAEIEALQARTASLEREVEALRAAIDEQEERLARAEMVARRRERVISPSEQWLEVEEGQVTVRREQMPPRQEWRLYARTFADDIVGGIRLRRLRPESPLALMGFVNGDVVLSLDGAPVDKALDTESLVGALVGSEEVEVEVYRGGETVSFTIAVE